MCASYVIDVSEACAVGLDEVDGLLQRADLRLGRLHVPAQRCTDNRRSVRACGSGGVGGKHQGGDVLAWTLWKVLLAAVLDVFSIR